MEIREFIHACENNDETLVVSFLKKGISPNIIYDYSTFPMFSVAQKGHVNIAHILYKFGSIVELDRRPISPWKKTSFYEKSTPLIEAVRYGHLEMVKFLITHGADIASTDWETGNTPLLLACELNRTSIVQYLLEIEDVECMFHYNSDRYTAIEIAVLHDDILHLLLQHNVLKNRSACIDAIKIGLDIEPVKILKTFLQYGFDPNGNFHYDEPLLNYLIKFNHADAFMCVLPHCDVRVVDKNKNTPLHLACIYMNEWAFDALIDKSELDNFNNYRVTPLRSACINGSLYMAKTLLSKGVMSHLEENDHLSILLETFMYHHADIALELFMHGCNPLHEHDGMTACQWYIKYTLDTELSMYDLVKDAELLWLMTPGTVHGVFDMKCIRPPSVVRIVKSECMCALKQMLDAYEKDERACYTAFHEGENVALAKYRRGEEVGFQQAWIRGICRPMGNRHLRKLFTSYLVHEYPIRNVYKEYRSLVP